MLTLLLVSACNPPTNEVEAPVTPIPAPPSVEAGPDLTVLGGDLVTVRGAGAGKDGVPLSYSWRQDTGFPVEIEDSDNPDAVFTAPRNTAELRLRLRLTVTDEDGLAASDTVTVRVLPPGGVLLTSSGGNTGSLGSMADFGVRLLAPPIAAVRIPIWSSDEGEGVPATDAVEFTPGNWNRWQSVRVRGANAAIRNGRQDYWLRLGAIESADPAYSGLDPEDVHMRGLFLDVAMPAPPPLMPGMEARLRARTDYSGHELLSHTLTAGPPGAQIDLTTGEIVWTPGQDAEGGIFDFAVRVTDNSLFATTSFQVRVARPGPLPVSMDVARAALVVSGSGTGLDGLRIQQEIPEGGGLTRSQAPEILDLSALALETVIASDAPVVPEHVERLSEILLLREGVREAVTLRFPLPSGSTTAGVTLYAYGRAVDAAEAAWFPIGLPRIFREDERGKFLEIRLPMLEGLLFLGRDKSASAAEGAGGGQPATGSAVPRARSGPSTRADPNAVSCVADASQGGDNQICTSTEAPGMIVRVRGFGVAGSGATRWGENVRVEELVSWIVDARDKATELGMSFDADLSVQLEQIDPPGPGVLTLGRVFGGEENYAVLHLNNKNNLITSAIRDTLVHEFFHHAQSRIGAQSMQLIRPAARKGIWMLEGTANWFAEFVYNENNYEASTDILSAGLHSCFPDTSPPCQEFTGRHPANPYYRDVFFLLLEHKCTSFRNGLFPNILVTDVNSDPYGIQKLRTEIQKSAYACDFGTHLGESRKSTLEAALSYYQYATQFQNKVSLFDPGAEANDGGFQPRFSFSAGGGGGGTGGGTGTITTTPGGTGTQPQTDDDLLTLQPELPVIPPAGAFSFRVPANPFPSSTGKNPVLDLNAGSVNLIVSITSQDSHFVGVNSIDADKHRWFETRNQGSLSYFSVFGNQTPAFFVTVVNPEVGQAAPIGSISLRLQDENQDERVTISTPVNGASLSERVITVQGTVPAGSLAQTSAVRVRSGGISTTVPVSPQGEFSANVVIAFGAQTIIVNALDSSGNVITLDSQLEVQGVAATNSARNALVPARAVFILSWDAARSDFDLYADGPGGMVWWGAQRVGNGQLDFDDRIGSGPEVITYQSGASASSYAGATFAMDVHYFEGESPGGYALSIILNEQEPTNIRRLHYASISPIAQGSSSDGTYGPNGDGASRHNSLLTISCDNVGVCSLSSLDRSLVVAQ